VVKRSRTSLDLDTFAFAAFKGDLEILKWLKDQGCPYDEFVFANAAANRNLENKYLIKVLVKRTRVSMGLAHFQLCS
jgi:hypothetical protein